MKAKKEKKSNNFGLDKEYGASIVEARRQEMEGILPGFYTVQSGVVIPSKPITAFKAK